MRHYGHLTLCEREDIMLMRREGRKIAEIAAAIGRSKSTVSRELARNSCQRFYRASTAQGRYESRRKACRRPRILDNDDLFRLVGDKFLGEQWSPEQIEVLTSMYFCPIAPIIFAPSRQLTMSSRTNANCPILAILLSSSFPSARP